MSFLDLRTLFVVSAVVIAFSGCVLILARGRDSNATALSFWGSAMLAGAAGITLLALEIVAGRVVGIAGTATILAGTALSWTGARVFAGRRPSLPLILAGPAAWALVRALPWDATALLPQTLALGIGAGYTLAAAAELWRGQAEPLQSRRAAVALLLLHAVFYAGRAVMLLFVSGEAYPPAAASVLMFEALLHTIGMAFLLLALMKERAELRATTQLRDLAMHDGLTGLGNRRQFDETLETEFRRAVRNRQPLALLMIDVDHFKAFNDTYGHQSGDDALCAVASAIGQAVRRPGDLAARYGGEEFAVLLPGTGEGSAALLAEVIHAAIAGLRIQHAGGAQGLVTVSIGVAAITPNAGSSRPDKLVRAADRALYEAKASGRNNTRLASQLRDPVPGAPRAGVMRPAAPER